MTTYLVDGKSPGQFKARCNLTVAKLDAVLTVDERHEAQEKGYRRSLDTSTRKSRWFVHFPKCEGFETTDPAAFVEHLKTVHGKRQVTGEWETYSKSVKAGWRPRLRGDLKPTETLKTCQSCGLVAEVDDRAVNVLWWAEHVRMCAGASAVAS